MTGNFADRHIALFPVIDFRVCNQVCVFAWVPISKGILRASANQRASASANYAAVHDLIVNFIHPGTCDRSKSLWNFVQTLDECNARDFISLSNVFFACQLILWMKWSSP